MRVLVIFDTEFGNTERVAAAIATALDQYADVRLLPADSVSPVDLAELDLLVVGSPTQGRGATKALRAVTDSIGRDTLGGLAAAAFDTRLHWPKLLSGSAADEAANRLRSAGCRLVAPPETFFVRGREGPLDGGELEHARSWAEHLVAQLEPVPAL